MALDDLWGHISLNEKFASSKCWNSWKVLKRLGVKQKIYRRKTWFETLR